MRLSNKIKGLRSSATVKMNEEAKTLARSGKKIINLSAGEPHLPLSEDVVCDLQQLIVDPEINKYPTTPGNLELRKMLSGVNTEKGASLTPGKGERNIFISAGGAKQAIFMALDSLVDPGDKVLIPQPSWVSYVAMVEMLGAQAVFLNTLDPNLDLALEVEKALEADVRAVILNNPNNPTGKILEDRQFSKILNLFCSKKGMNTSLIIDEVYRDLVFPGNNFRSFVPTFSYNQENLLIVNSFSKSYGMMGFRVGFVLAHEKLVKALTRLQGQISLGACTISQRLALMCLRREDGKYAERSLIHYVENRDLAMISLRESGVEFIPPQAGFYVLFQVPKKYDQGSISFCEELLREQGVALVPGDDFGCPGWVRLSFSCSKKTLKNGLKKVRQFVLSIE